MDFPFEGMNSVRDLLRNLFERLFVALISSRAQRQNLGDFFSLRVLEVLLV